MHFNNKVRAIANREFITMNESSNEDVQQRRHDDRELKNDEKTINKNKIQNLLQSIDRHRLT